MRFSGAVATALYSSALLLGNVRADDVEEVDSSSTTIEEATTTSILEKPTFTVGRYRMGRKPFPPPRSIANAKISLQISKLRSLSNSQTTGRLGGSLLTQKRTIPKLPKTGPMSANGQ